MKTLLPAIATVLFALHACPAGAQFERAAPLRMILPVPAGAGVDALARALSDRLSEKLKRPVVIESRPGAAGNLAAEAVARATPDGTTVLLSFDSVATTNPTLYPRTVFTGTAQLRPVTVVGSYGLALVVNPSVAVKDIAELAALSRKRPLMMASSGAGSASHLSMMQFKMEAGADVMNVPYKGLAPAITDVVGGHVDAMFSVTTLALPNVKAGKLRALAYTGKTRSPLLPAVPTLTELGLQGFDLAFAYIVFAPIATPDAIVLELYAAIQDAVSRPEVRERIIQQDVALMVLSPSDSARWIDDARARWAAVIRDAQITAE